MIGVAPASTNRPPKRKWPSGSTVIAHIVLATWAIITIFPIFWVFTSSVKTPEQIFEMPPKWIFNRRSTTSKSSSG